MRTDSLKFGIEIEGFVPGTGDFLPVQGGYHAGIEIDGFPAGWNCQRDASVSDGPVGYIGLEIVSPPLRGEDGLVQVVAVCDYLLSVGFVTNKKCGLHVHIDGRQLDSVAITRLVESFKVMEGFFYSLNGSETATRYQSNYTKPVSRWITPDGFSDRYQSLNLQNWLQSARSLKRTVEFRCFASTVDAIQVVAVIHMCAGLVALAHDGIAPEVTPHGILSQLRNPDYRIVPDAEIWDIALHMAHQYEKAA